MSLSLICRWCHGSFVLKRSHCAIPVYYLHQKLAVSDAYPWDLSAFVIINTQLGRQSATFKTVNKRVHVHEEQIAPLITFCLSSKHWQHWKCRLVQVVNRTIRPATTRFMWYRLIYCSFEQPERRIQMAALGYSFVPVSSVNTWLLLCTDHKFTTAPPGCSGMLPLRTEIAI